MSTHICKTCGALYIRLYALFMLPSKWSGSEAFSLDKCQLHAEMSQSSSSFLSWTSQASVNDCPIVVDCFFYLPSHECICLFTSHSHFYWYSCSRCNDTYPHPPSRPDSWFICSHGTVLLVTDWFSGRFVPTHPQPKALLCNHTKYVGNPFYFHT